jgi:nitroreductase
MYSIKNKKSEAKSMELTDCINNRRSIRKYKNISVEREKLISVIEAAKMAPSWKNSFVSRFYVAESEQIREKVLECLPDFNRESASDAPCLIVTTIVKGRSGFERDGSYSTHLGDSFQYFDNALAVENLCLKAYDEGLSTLIMGLYDNKKLREVLEIPPEQEIVCVIALGYGDEINEAPKRKSIEDIAVFK